MTFSQYIFKVIIYKSRYIIQKLALN